MTRLELATMLMVCLATGACAPKASPTERGVVAVPGPTAAPAAPAVMDGRSQGRVAPAIRPGVAEPRPYIDVGAPGGTPKAGGRYLRI